jgi:3-hydroxy acid dehydrogenase/malonic semialdehyde reductase
VILIARRADKLQSVKGKCISAFKESGELQTELIAIAIEVDIASNTDIEGLSKVLKGRKIDMYAQVASPILHVLLIKKTGK